MIGQDYRLRSDNRGVAMEACNGKGKGGPYDFLFQDEVKRFDQCLILLISI